MVYCGRPSRGCQTCKNRHVKCDETKPACLNCVRTNRDCPGFPQEADLVFRDQTTAVVKRLKSPTAVADRNSRQDERHVRKDHVRRQGTPGAGQRRVSRLEQNVFLPPAGPPDPILQCILNPSIEQQTTEYFFRNFVLPTRSIDTSRGFLNAAPTLYYDNQQGNLVRLAVHAVALATVGCWPGHSHIARLGEQLYGKALAAMQVALKDPSQATSDATLVATLLFSLYESITSSNHSTVAWRQHGEAAAAMVRARGLEQLGSALSVKLFRAVRTHTLLTSTHTGSPLPEFPGPSGWMSDIENGEYSEEAELTSMAVALPDLLCCIKTLTTLPNSPENRPSVEEALSAAHDMQQRHIDWELRMSRQWSYRTTAMMLGSVNEDNVDDLEAWPGPLHSYNDVHIASIRNGNRVSQALCSRAIMTAVAWLEPESYSNDGRYCFARNRVQELVDDVCSSVPFHIWGQQMGERARPNEQNDEAAQGLGSFFLIWPLYSCSMLDCIPDLQRRWLLGRLREVARGTSIDQAAVLEAKSSERMNHTIIESKTS